MSDANDDRAASSGDAAVSSPADDRDRGAAVEGEAPPRRKRRRRRRRKKQGDAAASTPAAQTSKDASAKPQRPRRRRAAQRAEEGEAEEFSKEIFSDKTFEDLGLSEPLLRALREVGFSRATKIQAAVIPLALAGKDILGQAKTGSGKTAAFGLPILQQAEEGVEFQAFILAPTRELAQQIAAELRDLARHTKLRVEAVFGGAAMGRQVEKLSRGPEIIVATPGRLIDLLQRKKLHTRNARFVVLDEVDRMLDIGFRDDIRRILRTMEGEKQTIFVSATISEEIERLARSFMRKNAERVESASGSLTVERVEQHYLTVERWDKKRLLLHLLTHEEPALTLVFCATKRMVDDLANYLQRKGVDAHAIHGDLPQSKRNAIMRKFREGELAVLVASDVAARGIDVEGISHVVNYDIPEDAELYIHRIGRTARAGARGVAWSFVTPEEGEILTRIEKLANVVIPKMEYPDFTPSPPPPEVQAQREAAAARARKLAESNRYAPPPLPAPGETDESRFPMGLVPTTFPPRRLQGRVKRRPR